MTENAYSPTWHGPVSAVTIFTDDLRASREFYRHAFGLSVYYEDAESAVFKFPNLLINVLDAKNALELIDPAPVAPAAAGARVQFTIDVDDVDATCARLAELGVELLNGPLDRPWGIRTAAFQDPGGHIWEIAHPLA